jgi:predicted RNase H-like HicB family nuclease
MTKKDRNRYILLTLLFKREGKVWTAECKELGTASFGDTIEEAIETIEDMVKLHLDALEDAGERERFLQENHVKVYDEKPKEKSVSIELPFGVFGFKDLIQLHAS